MFGYADEDMVGHNIMLLLPSPYGEDRDGHLRIFVEVGERNVTTNVREVFGRRIDGSTFPVEVSVTEVEQSQIFTCVIHDISERKQLQSHVLEIAGNEQRRIGLELHDGIGQELTGLALHAGSLVELLRTVDYYKEDRFREVDGGDASLAKARELAARISTRLNETNRHVRHLAHGIMPVQIEPEGLQTALEELATSIDLQGAVDCQFECFDSIRVLNNSVATHLYCIAQEAVNNALKHSHGDEITISLRNQGDCVVLEIRDNGIGIEAAKDQQAQPSHGMGLRTMQYRCATVSGTFRVDTRREIGTAIICLVPQAGSGR
jgi:PAS domain S-box-containing protein